MKKKKSIWKNSSLYFILVLGLLSVFLMLQLILTPILPNKYIIILGIVLLIINALLIILMLIAVSIDLIAFWVKLLLLYYL